MQVNCPLKPTQVFGLMVSHRHFYLMATAKEAKEEAWPREEAALSSTFVTGLHTVPCLTQQRKG